MCTTLTSFTTISFPTKMETSILSRVFILLPLLLLAVSVSESADPSTSFEENFDIMWSEDHFTTSEDGQIWHLALDNDTGTNSIHITVFKCVLCNETDSYD